MTRKKLCNCISAIHLLLSLAANSSTILSSESCLEIFSMDKLARSDSLSFDIVVCKYVLILFSDEKLRSHSAVLTTIVKAI